MEQLTSPGQRDIAYHTVSCSVKKIFKERRTKEQHSERCCLSSKATDVIGSCFPGDGKAKHLPAHGQWYAIGN